MLRAVGRLLVVVAGTLVVAGAVVLVGFLFDRFGLQDAANYAQLVSIPLTAMPIVGSLWVWRRRARERAAAATAPAAPAVEEEREEKPPGRLPEVLAGLWTFGEDATTSAVELGVRPAIPLSEADGILDDELPAFVRRGAQVQVTRLLRRARRYGGMYLLVGDSSVGKTRLLYECVRAELSDFAVLAPAPGDGDAVNALADDVSALPAMVVWLDEVHRFLAGPFLLDGDTAILPHTVRALQAATTPVVIVGTAWPDHLRELRATEPLPDTRIRRARYPSAVEVLDTRRCTTIAVETFTQEEREAAIALRDTDPRIAQALDVKDFNLTEALSGVPTLMTEFASASGEAKALVHCLVDATRLGVHSPLPEGVLRDAARGYLREVHCDDMWFPEALAEAAAGAITAIPAPDRSHVTGYVVTDYLAQHLTRRRTRDPIPAATWAVLADEITDAADLTRLAESAAARRVHRYAVPLLGGLVAAGHAELSPRLVDVLAQWGDSAGLERWRRQNNTEAKWALNRVAARGWESLPADSLDQESVIGRTTAIIVMESLLLTELPGKWRLADLLEASARTDKLAELAKSGDHYAAVLLARGALVRKAVGDAEKLLAPGVRARHPESVRAMAAIRYRQDDHNAVRRLLRPFVSAGERWAMNLTRAAMMAARDAQWLTSQAEVGDIRSARAVVRLLAEDGDLDALTTRADDGDRFAATLLDKLLADRGDLDALVKRATNDGSAVWLLATAPSEKGGVDRLRELVESGDGVASAALARLLYERGAEEPLAELSANRNGDAAVALARLWLDGCTSAEELLSMVPELRDHEPAWFHGRPPIGYIAMRLHDHPLWSNRDGWVTRVNLDPKADIGDVVRVLRKNGDVQDLRWLVSIGRPAAAIPLAELLLGNDSDVDGVLEVLAEAADDGHAGAAQSLAFLSHKHRRVDELRRRAALGEYYAAWHLAIALSDAGDVDQLVARARAGDAFAADFAAALVLSLGDDETAIEILTPWAEAGSDEATRRLSRIHEQSGDLDTATTMLHPSAAKGDAESTRRLVALAYLRGDAAELRDRADAGDRYAAQRLALHLYKQGDVDALHREVLANNTDEAARVLLILHRDRAGKRAADIHSLTPEGQSDTNDWWRTPATYSRRAPQAQDGGAQPPLLEGVQHDRPGSRGAGRRPGGHVELEC